MKLSLKNMSGVAAVAVALALVGTISSAMISSIYTERRAAERAEAEKKAAYLERIEALRLEKESLESDIDGLSRLYGEYIDKLASSGDDYYYLIKRFDELGKRYRFYAGLTEVAGEGIKISLDDANADSPDVTSFMIVHDTTLISIVDGLRASGAQAISINDERIVSSTDIVCVGPSISVNGKKVFSPFTIKAIGDAESLYSAFIESNAYKSISLSDLKIDVEKKSNVIIPKYAGMYE